MDKTTALRVFSALSQETRLEVVTLLIKSGPQGMTAGDIANLIGVRQNTLSAHLTVLLQAGLVHCVRESRHLRYRAEFKTVRGVMGFLLTECCGGQVELCRPYFEDLIHEP